MPEDVTPVEPAANTEAPNETTDAPEVPEWVNPETAYREISKAREEAKQSRLKAKELAERIEAQQREAERAKLDEVGRLKAELDDWQQKYGSLEQTVVTERKRAQLAAHVEHVDDALKLLDDDFVDPDGNVMVEKFLAAKPFLARQAQRAPVRNMNPPAREGGNGMDSFIRAAVKGR